MRFFLWETSQKFRFIQRDMADRTHSVHRVSHKRKGLFILQSVAHLAAGARRKQLDSREVYLLF